MSKLDIPDSWAKCKVGDVFTLKNGYAFKSSEFLKTGIKVVRISNIQDGSIDLKEAVCVKKSDEFENFIASNGDLLIAMSGATTGKMGVYQSEEVAYQNQRVGNIKPKSNEDLVLDFRNQFFRMIQADILKEAYGGAQPNISGSMIEDFDFYLPPLGEQKRIVAKIESTMSKINEIENSAKRAEELIGKYREAILQRAFRGELVQQNPKDEPTSELLSRIRSERAKQFDGKRKKQDDLSPIKPEDIPYEIPKSWEWVRLSEISKKITDGVHQKPTYVTNGVPFISVKDITTGILRFDDCKFVSKADHEKFTKSWKPERGDILYTKVGATYGRPCVVDTDQEFSIYVSVALIKLDKLNVNPHYISNFLKSFWGYHQAKKSISGIGVPDLHLVEIRDFLIPIPPLNEQNRIVDSIDKAMIKFQPLINVTLNTQSQIECLRSAIFRKAFSGQLVSQNPSEGTGWELLEKIKIQSNSAKKPIFKKNKIRAARTSKRTSK